MLDLRRILIVALTAMLLGPVALHAAQPADSAEPLLLQAQQQFDTLQFTEARATLWRARADRDSLDATQQALLNDLLGKVDLAIAGQTVAKAIHQTSCQALTDGDYTKAVAGFERVASCPLVSEALRAEAKANLARARELAAAPADAQRIAVVATTNESPAEGQSASEEGDASTAAVVAQVETTPKDTQDVVQPKKAEEAQPAAEPEDTQALSELQARKIKTQELIAKGQAALDHNNPSEAVDYFQRALRMDPENEEARRQLDYARQLTATPAAAGILSDYEKKKNIAKQRAIYEYQQSMNKSLELMSDTQSANDFDKALQAANAAAGILQSYKHVFTETEYREMLAKVEDQRTYINRKKQGWEQEQVAAQMRKMQKIEAARQQKMKMEMQERIAELVRRAQELRQERKFEDALRVIHQIIELDPSNLWAQDNAYMLREFILVQTQGEMYEAYNHELAKVKADIMNSEIPWYDKIRYPKDWVELTARRQRFGASEQAESEEDRILKQKMGMKIPRLNFPDVRFADVVEYLRDVSGISIYVNWGALESLAITEDTNVNIRLDDVAFGKALRLILDDVSRGQEPLSYVINEGVLTISSKEALADKTTTRVYDIRDLIIRVPNFVGPRVDIDAIGSDGEDGGGGGGVGLFAEADDTPSAGEEDQPTRAEMITKVTEMIKGTLPSDSWNDFGGKGTMNDLHGNLIITQTPENHLKINELIAKLRETRTIQISIEARFIQVDSLFLSGIGIDLDMYFNVGSSVYTPQAFPASSAAELAGGAAALDSGERPGAWLHKNAALRNVSPVPAESGSWAWVGDILSTATDAPASPAMSIAGTFLDDIQVDFLIEATQAHQATRSLDSPRITLLNGQRAYVSVATQQAYVSGAEPIVSENMAIYRPIISYVPSGTMLDVDATVSPDRRYVTMTVRPQVVNLENNPAPADTADIGAFDVTIGLPEITLNDLQTTCSVPDGGTLLLAGNKISNDTEREMGPPVISKLPVINRAFTNRAKVRNDSTLLILIKPTIMIQDEIEEDPRYRVEVDSFQPGFHN